MFALHNVGVDMIKLQANKMRKQNNKTHYWLCKQLGMSWTAYKNMVENKTKSISYENIEALCQIFQCTPNELFMDEE